MPFLWNSSQLLKLDVHHHTLRLKLVDQEASWLPTVTQLLDQTEDIAPFDSICVQPFGDNHRITGRWVAFRIQAFSPPIVHNKSVLI